MKTVQAIKEANTQGRLGLLIYSIPNFPNPESYAASLRHLEELPFVSAIETTVPVSNGFSDHANSVIVESHRIAASHNKSWKELIQKLSSRKPTICVLYRETADAIGFETFLKTASGRLDAVLLEWSEPDEEPYRRIANNNKVGFIACVGPWMNPTQIHQVLQSTPEETLVYLMSAPMTGAKLFSSGELARTIEETKRVRPLCKVAAGFGIQTAEDIRTLARVPGLDAVIIGTGFLAQLRNDPQHALTYLRSMEGALSYV